VSNDTNQPEQELKVEPQSIELLDCGQASKKTQGFPLVIVYEGGHPPFDKLLF
jgi:hypothetical protein